MARGNRKSTIFEDDRDRVRFLRILTDAVGRYEVIVHADCLMRTHFHLVLTTPEANLSEFMRYVDGVYTQYSNWRHKRVGHLLQGPFKSILIDSDTYLVVAASYVVMNPVAAGLVAHPEEWKWSSYRATAGLTQVPQYLSIDWLRSAFPAATLEESRAAYRSLFDEPAPSQAAALRSPAIGSEQFRKSLRSFVGENLYLASLPRSYRALFRPTLEELFASVTSKAERCAVIQRAHVVHGYRMSEIARALGLHPASVSRIVCQLRRDGEQRVRNVENWDLTPNSTSPTSLGRGRSPRRGSFPPRRRRTRG